jgi:hypothetical protein
MFMVIIYTIYCTSAYDREQLGQEDISLGKYFFKFRIDKSNIEMHSTLHLVNLGKYLLINSMLVDNFYYRDFYNRATGLLGTNKGHCVTELWQLS